MPKRLLVLPSAYEAAESETGMGYFVAPGSKDQGAYAVLSDGTALPLQQDIDYYDLKDLLGGAPLPGPDPGAVKLGLSLPDRVAAAVLFVSQALKVSPSYLGSAGAFPLVSSLTLQTKTSFYRIIQSASDGRFRNGQLTKGTYLTTHLELPFVNTGFAVVGRFALPLPVPACRLIQYELPAKTRLRIGTVAPLFGQAGGGVEVCLQHSQPAVQVGSILMPAH